MIVESKDGNPSTLSFMYVDKNDWKWIGIANISVSLRRELKINININSFDEDLPLSIKGNKDESFDFIKDMFFCQNYEGDEEGSVLLWDGIAINFMRVDISDNPIGPKINVSKWTRLP